MNWTALELHKDTLHTIVDAAIPNKAQNVAVKKQIDTEVNDLMNRIANGWLDDIGPAEQVIKAQEPGTPSPKGTVLCGDDGRIIGVSDGNSVLRVEPLPA